MLDIGLTVLGIYTLVTGKWPMGKKGYLVGREARILGILSVLTIPAGTCCTLITLVIVLIVKGPAPLTSDPPWILFAPYVAFIIIWVTVLFVLNSRYGKTGRLIGKDEPVP